MPKKDMENDQMMDDFEDDSGLGFEQTDELDFAGEEDLLLEESDDDDEEIVPSVLYKGISRPKTDDDWRQLLMEASREGVPEYNIADTYKEGALLLHPSFGLGVVTKLISSRKMEVIFESSKKLMAMNITPPDQAA